MRSCVCGGSNENCCWCFGSGYIREGQRAPRWVGDSSSLRTRGRLGRSRPRKPCPICNALVTRLQKHIKQNSQSLNRSRTPAGRLTSRATCPGAADRYSASRIASAENQRRPPRADGQWSRHDKLFSLQRSSARGSIAETSEQPMPFPACKGTESEVTIRAARRSS